ncbi:hypothetical protein H6P81_016820 [Aristolochia fimbriata]|uniref:Uncharacterized protein n=1 Tax=Aristolochia fimbriata TaxID=158543 RepID=A0AAV7EBI6_ARIFI|nr:hypothetical protein H6P81_016820 [Aristolochia fimbriata]
MCTKSYYRITARINPTDRTPPFLIRLRLTPLVSQLRIIRSGSGSHPLQRQVLLPSVVQLAPVSLHVMAADWRLLLKCFLLLFTLPSSVLFAAAYRPGDIVPLSKMGQYHASRTVWQDVIGRHCPIFAVNREVLIPIAKPTGYTGADPYKISFQVGKEKFLVPWLLVINRKSTEVPMIDVQLRYSGSDLHGVTAKVIDMPHHYLEIHPDIRKHFWDVERWPKHILVRYTWKEHSEIDVASGFYVLFGSGLVLSFILAIYVLQSSQEKLARFVRETVVESSMPGGGIAKVE